MPFSQPLLPMIPVSSRTPTRSWDGAPLSHQGSQRRSCIPPSIHPADRGPLGYNPQRFGHHYASGFGSGSSMIPAPGSGQSAAG